MLARRVPIVLVATCLAAAEAAAEPVSFRRDVAPILEGKCLGCHSGSRPKGELNLTERTGLLTGGATGPALIPNKSADSLLIRFVADMKMPPKAPLSADEVALLRRWVDEGATWEGGALKPRVPEPNRRAGSDWWSLQPILRPAIRVPSNSNWINNPIDAFVLKALEAKGLIPNPDAERRTLIRRVSLDLTGLWPTPEEVEAFERAASPQAYEKLVDRLLASPAYGERWARHWLDVARFAESSGYEVNTLRPNAWPYRDWVIRAFNRDLPFEQFVREQLAGDTIHNADNLTAAATGFIVGGPHDLVGNQTVEGMRQQRSDDLFDMVSTTTTAFLGLTAGCARCHDHKFDPILQRDFYALEAIFAGVDHSERPLPATDSEDRRKALATSRSRLIELDRHLDASEPVAASELGGPATRPPVNPRRNVERFTPADARFIRFTVETTNDGTQPCIDELEVFAADYAGGNLALAGKATASSEYPNAAIHKIAHLNDGQRGNTRSWISNEAGMGWAQIELASSTKIALIVWGRDREEKFRDRLPTKYRIEVSEDGKSWSPVAGSWDRGSESQPPKASPNAERDALIARIASFEKQPTIYAGAFRKPDATRLLKRGDVMQPGEPIAAAAIAGIGKPMTLPPNCTDPDRRRALAIWIAENPLSARVMVNRIWHYHFGKGIVRTPSDFGFNGDRPSHPELLDLLAAEFQANGGLLKPMHRLIVLSHTYRQASRIDDAKATHDGDNRLLWRYPSRRIEAEAVRDNTLQAAGSLNRAAGGPGYNLWTYSNYVTVFTPKTKLGPDEFRRMVYQFKPRTQQDYTFGTFDCPDATAAVPKRQSSTTALQALNLLNDAFILDQAERLTARVRSLGGADAEQVAVGFRLVFQRQPTSREAEAGVHLVRAAGLSYFCRMLLNANEFVTLE